MQQLEGVNMQKKQKVTIALFVVTLIFVFSSNTVFAQSIYAYIDETRYIERLECPKVDFNLLFDDQYQQLAAIALRQWFVSEYAMYEDWCDLMWNHQEVILLEPYIIRIDKQDEDRIKIYCSSAIASYGLFEADDASLYLAQNLDTVGLFEIDYLFENDSWFPLSVKFFDEMNEELFPGSGIGTDGFPGLSDELAALIPNWGWGTNNIAARYLFLSDIPAEVVDW